MRVPESDFSLRAPSAWMPIAMSAFALGFMILYVAAFGIANEPGRDEGAPARLFQLLMLAQWPIIAFFALRWLPRAPKQGLVVLALQIVAWAIPIALIVYPESGS
jgi:hypothetical protein